MNKVIPVVLERPGSVPQGMGVLTRWPILGGLLRSGRMMTSLRVFVLLGFCAAVGTGLWMDDARTGLSVLLMWGVFWPLLTCVVTPTLGNAWCGICPHGFIGKWLNRVGLRRSYPERLRGVWVGLVSIVLGYWVIAYAMPGALATSTRTTAGYFLVFSLAAFGFFYVFKDMAWCKHLCPLGRVLASHGKVGVLQIRTDLQDCKNCRNFDCAKACAWHLSPFRFESRNNMEQCTLCMDCVASCDSVHLAMAPPGHALQRPIVGADRSEMWVFLVILAVAGVGVQFLHGLQHTPLKDHLPWNVFGSWLQGAMPFDAEFFRMSGLLALVLALVLTLPLAVWAYHRAALVAGKGWTETANMLSAALAPLAIIGLIPHAILMFATRNGHALVNEVSGLVGANLQLAPFAQRGDAWLGWLNFLPYAAMAWTLWLVWQRAGLLTEGGRRRWLIWLYGTLPVWLYVSIFAVKLAAMLFMAQTTHVH